MTDQVVSEQPQVQLTPEQQYLRDLLEKFNVNPEDSDLDNTARVLLTQIKEVQKDIVELSQKIDELNGEIKERQERGAQLVQQVVHKQGESQGYVNTLLKLRK